MNVLKSARLLVPPFFLAALLALLLALGCGGPERGKVPKVIVLGFDGMDHGLTQKYMDAGLLPNFSRLAEMGGFQPLATSVPPLSPVAWSDFITGMDSGGHGIYDFIHRDPQTMIPYLSTSRTEGAEKTVRVGKYQIPLSGGKIELLRRGTPFWELLEEAGYETTVVRMPANFPPSGTATRELSGMGTPDVLGTYGTFSFYTSELFAADRDVSGGDIYEAWPEDGIVYASLYGPDNPFLAERAKLEIEFQVHVDPEAPVAKLEIGNEERILKVGEWSDWVPIEFEMVPTQTLPGMARFFLRALEPEFELYVSPINFDPFSPALPISHPEDFAAELAEVSGGRFYTQGMPEDVQALKGAVLTRDDFLVQAELAGAEIRDQYARVVEELAGDFLFYYFGNLDQVSHMMYRSIDPEHPAYDPEVDPRYAKVIEELYKAADAVVGMTLEQMSDETTLVVMSDHGFAPLRRRMSINTWLKENGYLTVKDPNRREDPGLFTNVDLSRTKAYGVGLNGLYVNLQGRERQGIVPPAEREALMEEIAEKLLQAIDPKTGTPAVTKVYLRERFYESRGELEIGPDMVVGFAWGTGGSDDSSLGGVPQEMFTDNTGEWTGDHGMDHETVPGILFTSRPLERPATSLKDLAASILAEYGIDEFPAAPADVDTADAGGARADASPAG